MLRRLASLTALVVAPVLALSAVPAHAGSWSAPDPVGDAVSIGYEADPPPCGTFTETPTREGDIRRISVRHSARRVRVRLDVTGLVSARRTAATVTVTTPGRAYEVYLDGHPRHGAPSVMPFTEIDEDDVDECGNYAYASDAPVCAGVTTSIEPRRDLVTLSIPRRCLRHPRWVRVGASVQSGNGAGTSFDHWVPRGWDGDYLAPIVGRKVFAPR